ncbi:heat shock protein [Fulvia fulva]|uniref:Heat shock protein n=1 Tax=Passalora fulva TaxID=5499 RepID=A0A9Q8L7S7_PASFU|nr:heat shock protein [Fulvia fulva]KAK4634050.1 heat shock protein [Fulvia fulva]KAK4638534.1 heat shock protein [Fulvia fulva]UJO11753.1 heat shock protein [Fulvia fulva]WPV10412.1 heat shock protein [Fulvia fulva]WPV25142.1 heat shock protein [Fulvia fulva]
MHYPSRCFVALAAVHKFYCSSLFLLLNITNKTQTYQATPQHPNKQTTTANMSDALRQSNTDKAASALKPDSQKSALEQVQDSAKSTADSVAGTLQPEGEKSIGQKASDTVTGSGGDAQKQGEGVLQQAQDGAANLANQASETISAGVKQAQDALGLNQGGNAGTSGPK